VFLTAYNLPHYLMTKGLAGADTIVDGDFMLAEAGRRNRNFKIFRRKQGGLFVKQIKTADAQAITTIQREAAFYRTVHSDAKYAALSRMMPGFFDYEGSRHALTLSLTENAESLSEHQMRQGEMPENTARLMGNALGIAHAHGAMVAADPAMRSLFPYQLPWPMMMEQTGIAFLNGFGTTGPQIVRAMQQMPTLQTMLSGLRQFWQYDSLIHGDMKWDNCLISQPAGAMEPQLTIVDWELADIGDGAWDVATIFKEYLVAAILSFNARQNAAAQNLPAPPDQSIARSQPSIRAFWKAYMQGRGLSGAQAAACLDRAVRYTAARMIIAVLEYLGASSQFSPLGDTMLETARGILESPQAAAAQMIGVPAT